ncbi:hypothetical protein [Pseudomonas sp. SCB32]|nr:hypothetical protein [Pseudomonas sp. SCB32]
MKFAFTDEQETILVAAADAASSVARTQYEQVLPGPHAYGR